MKKAAASPLLLALTLICVGSLSADILSTKHNLSVSGPGDIKALGESEVCIFCHTPHNASPQGPLWNRQDPGRNYIPYTSSTLDSSPGQPTGASLLCLSCHDGTIALGDLISRDAPVAMTGGVTVMPDGRTKLGTDLSDDHPVSFYFTEALAAADGKLVSPSLLTGQVAVQLDASGQMQCTTCHDPHDNSNGKFLVHDSGPPLCEHCHYAYHDITSHQVSAATWNGVPPDPWPNTDRTSVGANSCYSCHTPHAAGGERLLKYPEEERVCLDCHNGNVARSNIASALAKPFTHPLSSTTGVHDPVEDVLVTNRHVECQDCHNPHAVRPKGAGGDAGGTMRHARGITLEGMEIAQKTYSYQVCFRCHGDSQPAATVYTSRLISEPNIRLDFSLSNPSFHPVGGPGRNPDVPSLIAPLSAASTIECTDCHNNDGSRNPVYPGPTSRGPHGSNYRPILEEQYITTDPYPESEAAYALCYKCHERNSILNDESFVGHRLHITGAGGAGGHNLSTPCNVCHDPHGVRPSAQHSGTKLINFDMDVVQPNAAGSLYYQSAGRFEGSCYLSCHGKDHNPCTYGGATPGCTGG